jgi:nucleoside-diphosphate-sugar epimerase
VIGGTRFMGPEVVRLLHAMGHDVTVFHRGQNQGELPEGVRRIAGDRRHLEAHAAELRRLAPDVVVDMLPMLESDARGVVDVFTGVASRVVAVSSMDVYRNFGCLLGTESGPPDTAPYPEEGPLRQNLFPYRGPTPRSADDPNAWRDDYDKIPVERLLLSQPALPGTVIRLPVVYGPRDGQRRIYGYLKRMDDRRPAILLDETVANWRWSRGYMENTAAAIVLVATDERAAGRVYNVGDQQALSTEELVRAVAEAANWQGEILVLPSERLPQHLRASGPRELHMVADTARIRAELGYREPVALGEGIRRTVAWDRANPPASLDAAQFDYAAEDAALAAL